MGRYYDVDEYKYPSVTTIIGACLDKPNLRFWYANKCADYIEENCEEAVKGLFYVGINDLTTARTHAKEEGKRAMQIGTNVHAFAEGFLDARI